MIFINPLDFFLPPPRKYLIPSHSSRSNDRMHAVDISLDVSSVVLSTLRDTSKLSPVPFLSAAAGIVVDIVEVVQKVRRNKYKFKALAEDSCELVYVIICACKDYSSTDDAPVDLVDNLQELVMILTCIQQFAQEGASRNYLKAAVRSGIDASEIQRYREKLQQSMRVFCLRSDIALRKTVAKLVSHQVKMKELGNHTPLVCRILGGSAGASFSEILPSSNLDRSEAKPGVMTILQRVKASGSKKTTTAITYTTVMDNVGSSAVPKGRGVCAIGVCICIAVAILLYAQLLEGRQVFGNKSIASARSWPGCELPPIRGSPAV